MRLLLVMSCLFYFMALLMQMKACNGCVDKERMALLDIKAYFVAKVGEAAETELVSWIDDSDSNCCSWNRVKCANVSTGHVTELCLNNLLNWEDYNENWYVRLTLNFSLLSPFQELVSLDLSGNNFDNWIHNEGFSSLKKLENLDLSSNSLNTSIFLSLNGLTSLRNLNLKSNDIGDPFPVQGFSSLKKLENLDLSSNNLNTSIFLSLNGLTSLRTLNLKTNNIGGPFPAQGLQNIKNLQVLYLNDNQMVGSIEGLQNIKNLQVLYLNYNLMVGSIEGLCKMKDLVKIILSYNQFGGKIPECLQNLTSLRVLDLSDNLFNGSFPSFAANLTSLAYLSLFGNYLQGSFSLSTLADHSKLQVLDISGSAQIETEKTPWLPKFQLKLLNLQSCNLNKGKGSVIPSFLRYQHDLQFIDLSDNKLVGEFPSWLINNNTRLQYIKLGNNLFMGSFHLFSIMCELFYLDISNNNISGVLQKDVGDLLPRVDFMKMSMNTFEGNIPASIGEMKEVEYLDLSDNHFSGELPKPLVTNCTFKYLLLSNNFLQGNISNFFVESTVAVLLLNNNNFSGTLEGIFKSMIDYLDVLDISHNSISGAIPKLIGEFYMLIFLAASNQLEGKIPFEISNMPRLERLDLSQNRLFGPIPHFKIPSLRFLYLQKNSLSGFIPHSLSESSELVILDLRDNQLSGDLPYWINKLSNLRILSLGGNKFRGHIPIQLCQLTSITIMDLSHNMLVGSIPSCFKNISFGMVTRNDYYGANFGVGGFTSFPFSLPVSMVPKHSSWSEVFMYLPIYYQQYFVNDRVKLITEYSSWSPEKDIEANVEFRTKRNYYTFKGYILENMTGLDLSCNKLSGNIPDYIGNLQQLHALNLSHNYFTGQIPMSLSNLTQIESLDLSYNNLSGQIPSQLTQLHFLSTFNVSYNNLSGMVPSAVQFGTFDDDNYRGNPNLCGPLLKNKCRNPVELPPRQTNETGREETTLDMEAFSWTFGAAYVTILLVILMVLCINAEWRMTWFYYMDKFIRLCFPSFPLY